MTRLGVDHNKLARWHIPIPDPLPPLLVGAFDSATNCYGINLRWATMFIVCADILSDRRTWDNPTDEQMMFIEQQVGLIQSKLLKKDDCTEDCPDCPPPVVSREYDGDCYRITVDGVPATDWICPAVTPEPDHVVGSSGLSYEELESFYMACINLAAGLKIENGGLYAKDDCCNWVLVGSISGLAASQQTAPKNFGTIAAISGGIAALGNSLPTMPAIPHPTTEFNNEWTRKCLKATALKYILQTLMSDIGESAAEIPTTGWATFMDDVAHMLAVTPLADLAVVAELGRYVTEWGASFLVGVITDTIADTEAWDSFVCDFANVMTGAETFTGQDVANFYAKAVTYTALFAEWGLDLIDNIVPTSFQARVNERISAVTCECSDYLPNGYTPPVGEGCFQALATPYGDQNSGTPAAGDEPFATGAYATGSGAAWVSKLFEVVGGISYDVMSLRIEGNLPFNISALKVAYSTSVSYDGTTDPIVMWLWRKDFADENWVREGFELDWQDGTTLINRTVVAASSEKSTVWGLELRAPAGPGQGRNVINAVQITISGTADDGGDGIPFVDLPLGQTECL